MQRRARYAKGRIRPELFGLSTLDTVTCALAGAIVLMIFMAALTLPGAPLELRELSRILQAGDGSRAADDVLGDPSNSANPLKKLVVLHIRFSGQHLPPRSVSAAGCKSSLTVSRLRSARTHFADNDTDDRLAIVAWRNAGTGPRDCERFTIEVEPASARWERESCEVTLVSGAHVQTKLYPRCPRDFPVRSNKDDVYRFRTAGV